MKVELDELIQRNVNAILNYEGMIAHLKGQIQEWQALRDGQTQPETSDALSRDPVTEEELRALGQKHPELTNEAGAVSSA